MYLFFTTDSPPRLWAESLFSFVPIKSTFVLTKAKKPLSTFMLLRAFRELKDNFNGCKIWKRKRVQRRDTNLLPCCLFVLTNGETFS